MQVHAFLLQQTYKQKNISNYRIVQVYGTHGADSFQIGLEQIYTVGTSYFRQCKAFGVYYLSVSIKVSPNQGFLESRSKAIAISRFERELDTKQIVSAETAWPAGHRTVTRHKRWAAVDFTTHETGALKVRFLQLFLPLAGQATGNSSLKALDRVT
ncbi:hypothetical protein SUGI_0170850 [Cryptomeria japonica]|nr:hypothetical protein SUGI_0170850 [Cryptomeria japonica]